LFKGLFVYFLFDSFANFLICIVRRIKFQKEVKKVGNLFIISLLYFDLNL